MRGRPTSDDGHHSWLATRSKHDAANHPQKQRPGYAPEGLSVAVEAKTARPHAARCQFLVAANNRFRPRLNRLPFAAIIYVDVPAQQ